MLISAETSQCGQEFLATTVQAANVTSPNYPDNYPNNVDSCVTTISADDGLLIELYFQELDIEYHSTCGYDYLEV